MRECWAFGQMFEPLVGTACAAPGGYQEPIQTSCFLRSQPLEDNLKVGV